MKNIYRIITIILLMSISLQSHFVFGGNDKRRGTPGAGELLLNPWARSAGWGGVNTANGRGLDALHTNVAGLAFTKGTDLQFAYTSWFQGSGTGILAGGIAQRIGRANVLGLSIMSMSYGKEDIRSEASSEGGNGQFSPTAMNLNISYAHSFTANIHGGATLKIITEGTDNLTATGFALDAGIQYVTGENDEIKFGLAMKNWGPSMQFDGGGFSKMITNAVSLKPETMEYKSQSFEIPTILNIGASYDFLFKEYDQRFTIAGNFNAHAFGNDQYILGGEYAFLSMFQVRAAYVFEDGIFNSDDRATFMTGLCAGVSIEAPLGKKKNEEDKRIIPTIKLDYAYRSSNPMSGAHTIGLAVGL